MTAMEQAIALNPDLIETARLDSDVMDIIDIIAPKDQDGNSAAYQEQDDSSEKGKKREKKDKKEKKEKQ